MVPTSAPDEWRKVVRRLKTKSNRKKAGKMALMRENTAVVEGVAGNAKRNGAVSR